MKPPGQSFYKRSPIVMCVHDERSFERFLSRNTQSRVLSPPLILTLSARFSTLYQNCVPSYRR